MSLTMVSKKGRGVKLQVGMVIAIEPMITLGVCENHTPRQRLTVVTDDGKVAAFMRTQSP